VNRTLVEQLLADESRSYRDIARMAGCSDYSVRSIARRPGSWEQATTEPPAQRRTRPTPEPEADEEPEGADWFSIGVVVALFVVGLLIVCANVGPIDLDFPLGDEPMR
jgi:hypothetical protein